MASPLVVCSSCRCHVRSAARTCPHCHANLKAPGGLQLMRSVKRTVRRQLLAVAAVGLGTASCGVFDSSRQSQTNPESLGDSGVSDSGIDSGLADAGLDPNVWGQCSPGPATSCLSQTCVCGWDGYCDSNGNCQACGCDAGFHCFGGQPDFCSNHTCYGAPPLIDAALA
jgi:hypothetical protein